ncbi:hypothetical protein LR48_Vigan10g113400 [Vigna angularis]|uniref:Uncharacterized protein n=1 Tax=Phaseolus angularis TaxID=3914 RepID=A0A0L9VK03_PHAAN|nr:hypothetical protein LR48_Vigan10g113400 [Vigna angularis]
MNDFEKKSDYKGTHWSRSKAPSAVESRNMIMPYELRFHYLKITLEHTTPGWTRSPLTKIVIEEKGLSASVLRATKVVSRFLTISEEKPGKLGHV